MGYFVLDVADRKKKVLKEATLGVFRVLYVCFCNPVYISDIACGLEVGLTGDVPTLQ